MPHKVVFIDDEEDLCDLYGDLFQLDDVEIHSFLDIEEAIQFTKDNDVSLCFIDYRMPKKNGLETRQEISEEIPCILLSGDIDKLQNNSFVKIASKPLFEEQFEVYFKEFAKKNT